MNPLLRAHKKFVKIITYPSIIDTSKEHKRANKHWNLTCMVKGHKVLASKDSRTCVRCGAIEER